MIKTTLTKLKKAYSTLSFAPSTIRVENNGKFYKLILSLMRRADKHTKPDKTEEEEYERAEVIAKFKLAVSDTAALFSKGLSKPEAFLAPPADNNQREKSTLSNKDDSIQKDLNNSECKLQEVVESMRKPVPQTIIQTETKDNRATQSDRQEIDFVETKNSDLPNSLQNAIPDIILDKKDYPDGRTTHPNVLCCIEKENSNGNTFNNLQNSNGPVKVNNMLNTTSRPYIRSSFCDGHNKSPSIKFFASHDKTKKPPSTETNSTFDELAKHCLDTPNNKIDERLLKEMKKLGVPQTSPRSENSVIEENIIQMDVLRKPRRPVEKTEIDVETTKCEHPPLNYSDEQRLEFEPSTAEEEDLLQAIHKNKKETLALQFCNVKSRVDGEKPLLSPFDKRSIKFDDDGNNDLKDAKSQYHTIAPGAVHLEKTNEPLKYFHAIIQKYSQKSNKSMESHRFSENKPSNPSKSSIKSEQDSTKQSESIADKVAMNSTSLKKPNTVDYQPKAEWHLSKQSEKNANNVTMNSTPITKQYIVDDQAQGKLDLSKQSGKNADNVTVNCTPVNEDAVDFKAAYEPHVLPKLSEDTAYTATIRSTPLNNPNGVNFQAEGELTYTEKSENKVQELINRELEKRRKLQNIFFDQVPKIPEPLLVFNPPEQRSAKLSVHTNQMVFPRSNEDSGTDQHVAFVQNLKSLRIKCNVLPTKNTDEKSTISLLIEIDAIKQPREEFAARHQPDVTYREDAADQQECGNRSNLDHITRDKVTLVVPAKQERAIEAQVDSLPAEKPEIPLSEMLKRVRSRNRAEYCHQLAENFEHELETVTGKCGDKPKSCPPRCPPPQKARCPPTSAPPSGRPACPRPCRPAPPPACPPPCPKPCGRQGGNPCGRKGGNPCCPGAGAKQGGNPCCPGASSKQGGNPCCPGAGSKQGRNPCRPGGGSSSPRKNPCKFSTHLSTIMMNSFVSLMHQSMQAESELAQNDFFTKDAYQRFLSCACFPELYRPRLLPILNMCGLDSSLVNYEIMNSMLARDYDPWVPIPCWPVPRKEAKKPLPCPKGCQIPLPEKNRPPCPPSPCRGFPKRKNSFSIIDVYASWSNPI